MAASKFRSIANIVGIIAVTIAASTYLASWGALVINPTAFGDYGLNVTGLVS